MSRSLSSMLLGLAFTVCLALSGCAATGQEVQADQAAQTRPKMVVVARKTITRTVSMDPSALGLKVIGDGDSGGSDDSDSGSDDSSDSDE